MNSIPPDPTKETEPGSVRSVQRAVTLLTSLDPIRPAATLTDFTNLTGLATSTVQRLLITLQGEAMLRRLPDGRYTYGPRLIQIAVAALQGMELYDLVESHLDRLSAATQETANFAIAGEEGHFIYLRQSLSPRTLRNVNWLGRMLPVEGTAIGATLAGDVDEWGIASTRKTIEPDVTAIAAPLLGPGGTVVGALNITGPTFRIDDKSLVAFGHSLAAEARALTRQLGGTWPYRIESGAGN